MVVVVVVVVVEGSLWQMRRERLGCGEEADKEG